MDSGIVTIIFIYITLYIWNELEKSSSFFYEILTILYIPIVTFNFYLIIHFGITVNTWQYNESRNKQLDFNKAFRKEAPDGYEK